METTKTKTFANLEPNTVINYSNCVTADDTDFVVLGHYTDQWGNWTKVLNLDTNEPDSFTQHSKVQNSWSIKDNRVVLLTPERAPYASTVRDVEHPEYGDKAFLFNEQPLTEGRFAHCIGRGSNGFVLDDANMFRYAIISFKDPK